MILVSSVDPPESLLREQVEGQLRSLRRDLGPLTAAALDAFLAGLGVDADPLRNFVRVAQPVVHLPLWVAEALSARGCQVPAPALWAAVESAVMGYLCAQVQDEIVDGPAVSPARMLLAHVLFTRHHAVLASLVEGRAPFWQHYAETWTAYAEALALEHQQNRGKGCADRATFERILRRSRPLMIPGAALLAREQQWELAEPLERLVRHTTMAAQLFDDAVDAPADLEDGNRTWIVRRFGGEGGPGALREHLYLRGGFEVIVDEALAELASARDLARGMGMTAAVAALGRDAQRMEEARVAVVSALAKEISGVTSVSEYPRTWRCRMCRRSDLSVTAALMFVGVAACGPVPAVAPLTAAPAPEPPSAPPTASAQEPPSALAKLREHFGFAAPSQGKPTMWDIPSDVNFTNSGPLPGEVQDAIALYQPYLNQFAWQTFIAINWPALENGDPDHSTWIGAGSGDASTVWEHWMNADDIFRPHGEAPLAWGQRRPVPASCPKSSYPMVFVDDESADTHNVTEPGTRGDERSGPLIDQHRRYARFEEYVNKTTYDYIVKNQLYNVEGQAAFKGPISFPSSGTPENPAGAMEVKVAWMVLDGKGDGTYHTARALFTNRDGSCKEARVAMVGMSVAYKVPTSPNRVWSTFENVNNVLQPEGGQERRPRGHRERGREGLGVHRRLLLQRPLHDRPARRRLHGAQHPTAQE